MIKWKEKILLAQLETTYGTDPSPDGGNGMLVKDIRINPMEGEDVARDLELPYQGTLGTIPVGLHTKITFMVEIAPSGTAGVAPAWGPLLRACGLAEAIVADTSVTYNPVSAGHESAALYFWNGPTLYKILGARGSCKLVFTASQIPYLEFEFTGLWSTPVDETRVAPTNFASFQKPVEVSALNSPTFSVDGTDMVMRMCSLDLGNQVEPRFLVGSQSIELPDRAELLEASVEATPLDTFDPYAAALSGANMPVVFQHGTQAGRIMTLNAPFAQMQRVATLEEQQNITEWPLKFSPRPSVGNDQFTLTLT